MFRNDFERPLRPRMLLAYSETAHASRCVRFFRRQGWEVHMVPFGAEAQRLADVLEPQVVVLDLNLPDESGWLSCAKILLGRPDQRVILLSGAVSESFRDRAASLGAAGVA